MSQKGKVYLVGAGPGDPGLITVRGLQLLRSADLVLVDALVPTELLNEIKPGCELIDAGKRSGRHRLEQAQINKLLIRCAQRKECVVRLKGGDPFLFGRGGEEGEALKRAGVPFEVVPGVSSALAVPAYAGIPLTHRDYNSSVTILTGHGEQQDSEVGPAPLDWAQLARQETLVMLMGMRGLARNLRALVKHGKDPRTPAAIIQWGTMPEQRTITGALNNIVARARAAKIQAPAIIVVGAIARLRSRLNWFEKKPLFAKHILVTRSRYQAGELSDRLRAAAARVTEIPTIEIQPPKTWRPLDQAITQLQEFSWLVLTSSNGVDAFFERLAEHNLDARALGEVKIAVIGPMTARRLSRYALTADSVADSYRAEGLLKKLSSKLVRGKKILIARAEQARSILPDELKQRGADVTVAPCYRSVIPTASRIELKRLIREDPPDLLTFASSSMVTNFAAILKKDPTLWKRARKIPAACIGPITAQTAKELGLHVAICPRKYTIPDLVAAIEKGIRRL